jgi:DNA-binding protein Fis
MASGDHVKADDLGLTSPQGDDAGSLEEMSLEDVEKLLVQKAMRRFSGNVSQAAQALGLSRSALYRRLEKYRL